MAGCNKVEVQNKVRKKLVGDLKKKFPTATGSDIRAMAGEISTAVTEKAANNVANTATPVLSQSVKSKASTDPVPTKIEEMAVPELVMNLSEAFGLALATEDEVLNAETVAGIRNVDGEMIVSPVRARSNEELVKAVDEDQAAKELAWVATMKRLVADLKYSLENEVEADTAEARSIQGKIDELEYDIADEERSALGSSQREVEMTHEEITEFYYDKDGSISNSANVNKTLKELDKKNLGDAMDTQWSKELDSTLNAIIEMVGDINDSELKIKKSSLQKAAGGTYDPNTGEITVRVDNNGNGQEFRNRFTMTNQEVYVHEVVHSVIDYAFEEKNLKAAKATDLVNMISESKRLYDIARKNTTWEDLLIDTKHPTLHEINEAKLRYEHIFSNATGYGLHEFMAHLLTNKQFANAMSKLDAGVQAKDSRTTARKAADIKAGKTIDRGLEESDMVGRITAYFRNLLNKILGLATARDGSITDAGSKLIFNIMKANKKAADKASASHTMSIPGRSAKFLEEQLAKVGKQFDKADAKLQEPIDKAFKAVLGKIDTRSAKKRFNTEYDKQKARFFRLKGAKTADEKNALEAAADKAATAKAEQVIADEAVKITESIKEIKAKVKASIDGKTDSKIYGVNTIKNLARLPRKLQLLSKLHTVSRGVYGAELQSAFATQYKELAEEMNFFEDTLLASILDDFYDKDGLYNEITDAILSLTHTVDGYREKMYEQVLAETGEWFSSINIHSDENKHYDAAMASTILRTDVQTLGVDAKGLLGLLANPGKVTDKIKALKAKVTPQQYKDARLSASYMVDGMGLITNADNIARGFGHGDVNIGDVDAKLVANIDELISLIALDMTGTEAKADMQSFLTGKGYDEYLNTLEKRLGSKFKVKTADKLSRSEYTDQVLLGVDNFIGRSRGMQEASAREMAAEPHNIVKGYMKETYSHDTDVEYFPIDQIAEKEREGYVFVRKVGKQTIDGPIHGLFIIKDNAVRRANGALGLQGTRQRGTTLADIVNRDNPAADNMAKSEIFREEMRRAKTKYAKGDDKFNMYPVFNKAGDIVNFRSTMSNVEKSELLDMESRGTQNIARSYGTSSTAKKTERHNKSILSRLRKDYDENYMGNEEEYITIEPETADSKDMFGIESNIESETDEVGYARMWARLPKTTREAAAEMFGLPDGKGGFKYGKIIVRKDLIMPLFGYDEVTITDLESANKWSANTRRNAKKFEKVFQDIMQIAKGNIVVKTTDVLIGNITSNAKILGYIGVNPVKGVKLLMLGQKELQRYEENGRELAKLKRDELSGIKFSKRRMEELENEIKNNSVHPLVEAGLYQSVVEDVSTKTDNNTVSNWFNDKRDEYVTNETANTAIQYMFLTEKTKPFQAMLKATQVSDFYFRYAQYHDAIENKGQTKEQALREVTDNYINYEAPLNKFIKYGDRMGPFFFITYFTRIQRVVKRIAKKNPARVTADVLQQFILDTDQDDILDQSILDANILGHYNPFRIFGNIWEAVSPSGLEFIPGFGGR